MNPNPSIQPDTGALQQHAAAAVHSHRRKIQALTLAALVLGLFAAAGSITIVILNELYVRPRQEKLAAESRALAWPPDGRPTPAVSDAPAPPETLRARILALEIDMMRVVSLGSMMVAGSVGLLGLGTVVLVVAVMLNRRATLSQVNASLLQISAQLRELRPS